MPVNHDLPDHLGIILDGNRRWAKANGLASMEGHRAGVDVFERIANHAFERGIKVLSAYVFSTENWNRTKEEVGYLMKLVISMTARYLKTFGDRGIKIVILGRRDGLSPAVLRAIDSIEENTRNNNRGTLAFCFNYGGQQELVDAIKKIVTSGVKPDDLTTDIIESSLYAPEIPPADLIIRTSSEKRLSGFMLYRSSYAELYFSDKHWPDFTTEDLDKALTDYASRHRRFGGNLILS